VQPHDRMERTTMEVVMKMILILIFSAAVIFTILCVHHDLDPYFPILRYLNAESANSFRAQALRLLLTGSLALEMSKSAIFGIICTLAFVLAVNRSISTLCQPVFRNNWRKLYFYTPAMARKKLFHTAHLFRHLKPFVDEVHNKFFKYFIPVLIFSGIGIGVTSIYGTIRGPMVLKMPFYLAMPFFSGAVLLNAVFSTQTVGYLNDKSVEILKLLKQSIVSKQDKVVLRSIVPLRIDAGPFFCMRRNTMVRICDVMLNYTVTLLVSM